MVKDRRNMKEQMEITTVIGCKNACSYCPQELTIKSYGDNERVLSMETFKTCIDNIPEEVAISFSGFAEPFQNDLAMQMILHAYAKKHPIRINTTMRGMTMDIIEQLSYLDIEEFIVHLQTKNEHFMEMDKYLPLLGFLSSKVPHLKYVYNGELDERVRENLKRHNQEPIPLEIKSRGGALFKPKHKKGKLFCQANKDVGDNIMLPNGDVVLCCMDFGLKHWLGNLTTNTYEELHKGPIWDELHEMFREKDSDIICRDCEIATVYYSVKHLTHPLEKPYKKLKNVVGKR